MLWIKESNGRKKFNLYFSNHYKTWKFVISYEKQTKKNNEEKVYEFIHWEEKTEKIGGIVWKKKE